MTTVEEAVAAVRHGDAVFVGTACATPRRLIRALEAREDLAPGTVQTVEFVTDGAVENASTAKWSRLRHRAFFVGRDTRELAKVGRVDYVPISIGEVHRLIATGRVRIDHAFIQVTPPDADGRCSLGVSVDIAHAAIGAARRVVVEVNPNMPFTRGESTIPVDRIDQFVLVDTPVIEYLHAPVGSVAERVARYVARIIDDGSTLQIGLGWVPNEMLRFLDNRRDLGIHSDVITEPLVDLIAKGVVTGSRKGLHQGQVVASYCVGTRRLYDLVHDNPAFSFRPIEYVCDPTVIAQHHKMVSVAQAFAIDLTGQVCADQFAGELYGGISSLPEFLRGAAAAEGGKAILCLASTTEDEGESRIRALLEPREAVAVARSDVHYVVTEYGIAYLFGRSLGERALALIEIAHPKFRDELLERAKQLGLLPVKQALKSRKAYPTEEERVVELRTGEKILLRPTRASDVGHIQELFHALEDDDVYTRFFTNLKSLSHERAQHLCAVSYQEEMAFVAVVGDFEQERVAGSACYYVNPSTNLADVAYMIHPAFQGKGLGTVLQNRLTEYAHGRGVRGFTADVLTRNEAMLRVFRKSGLEMTTKVASGTYEVTLLFR